MPFYNARVNMPGYMPETDPAIFSTPQEAWQYLADDRERSEDSADMPGDDYSDTHARLSALAAESAWADGNVPADLAPDGSGWIHGDTPGSDSPHDLGWVYAVDAISDADARELSDVTGAELPAD